MSLERVLRRHDEALELEALAARELNFDPEQRDQFTPENGWHLDSYCQPLPAERPGAPVAGGAWETARRLARDYDFADPSVVEAVYDPATPLEQRNMLLKLRFYGLRFHVGVRVGEVYDESRGVDGRTARVWGWSYRTLDGHLEMGQMNWEVWKWGDTGAVDFRIHAFSRPADDVNPLVRLGFQLFGRREQLKFLRHACRRMAMLTAAALDQGATKAPASGTLSVRPGSSAEALRTRALRR